MPALASIEEAMREVGLHVPQPHRVLVVDDESHNLEVAEAVLEDDCDVLTAERGAAALALLEREPVDVLIADQRMPQMTGVDLLTRVAKSHPETVRMVLTAYTDVDPMIEAVNRGDVYRFLIKPCDPGEMRAVVADAFRLKWTRTALQQVVDALAGQNRSLYDTHLQLAAAQEQLLSRTRLATLGRLAAGIAHDVRNCSAIISLLIQYMTSKQAAVDERTLDMAQQMVEGSRPLLELLDHVRRLASAPEDRQRVKASVLLDEVLEAVRKGPEPVPEVSIDLPADAPPLLVDVEAIRHTLVSALRGTARRSPPTEPLRLALCRHSPRASAGPPPRATDEGLFFELQGPGPGLSGQPLELRFARLMAEAQGLRVVTHEGAGGVLTTRIHLAAEVADVADADAAQGEQLPC